VGDQQPLRIHHVGQAAVAGLDARHDLAQAPQVQRRDDGALAVERGEADHRQFVAKEGPALAVDVDGADPRQFGLGDGRAGVESIGLQARHEQALAAGRVDGLQLRDRRHQLHEPVILLPTLGDAEAGLAPGHLGHLVQAGAHDAEIVGDFPRSRIRLKFLRRLDVLERLAIAEITLGGAQQEQQRQRQADHPQREAPRDRAVGRGA
jgi:hypothetical protein